MKRRINIATLLTYILLIFTGASVASTIDTWDEIKERMKKRSPELHKLKEESKVGENYLGLVEAVSPKDTSDKNIMNLVTEENADRTLLYERIATENKTTPELVARTNALRIFEKAEPNDFFMTKNEKWVRKKDLMKRDK